MKKLLLLTAILGSVAILPTTGSAATGKAVTSEQVVLVSSQPRRWRRGNRTVVTTRVVYRFGRRYRETIRVTYRGNRVIRTQVIRRVPLSRRVFRNY